MINFWRANSDRWNKIAWWLCVVTLPLPDTYNNASIILLAFGWLADGSLFKNVRELTTSKWAWPFLFYYVWLCVGLLYSPDLPGSLFTIEKKISFWALPMIAVTGQKLEPGFISFLKKSFVYSCVAVIIFCVVASIYFFQTGDMAMNFDFNSYPDFAKLHPDTSPVWSRFSYIELTRWAGLHPTYFSMYLVFCLVILLTEISISGIERVIHSAMGIVIGIFVALISTRISIIALLIAMSYLVVSWALKKKTRSAGPVLAITSLLFFFVWLNPISRFRMIEEPTNTSYRIDKNTFQWNSVNYRILEWQGSWSIIKDHFFLGVSTGAGQSSMTEFYSNFNASTIGLEHNAHNQYLQSWMENGIPGLVAFLACIIISFFHPPITSAHVCFLIIFSIICLTESIGERQKGIVFFTLFQALFLGFENRKG